MRYNVYIEGENRPLWQTSYNLLLDKLTGLGGSGTAMRYAVYTAKQVKGWITKSDGNNESVVHDFRGEKNSKKTYRRDDG